MMRSRLAVPALAVLVMSALAPAAVARGQDVPATPPSQDRPQEYAHTIPYVDAVGRQQPLLHLTVSDVVARTLDNNLDIVIERFNRELALQRLVSTRGFYDPTVGFGASLGSTRSSLNAGPGDTAIPFDTIDASGFGPSLRQNLLGGGTVTAAVSASRSQTTSVTPTVNPTYGSTLNASLTQPLLRGFLHTATDRLVKNGVLDVEIAGVQYRQKLTQVLQQVLTQYWELVFAIESYEARRQSKELAIVQFESTRLRVQSGLLAPVAVTAARAEIASRERDLLQAEVQIINAENGLKQLLSEDPASPIWTSAIVPADRPLSDAPGMTLDEALAAARARRPELEQLRLQRLQTRNDETFFSWEKLPAVSLTAGFTSTGKAGTVFQRLADGRVPDPANPAFGSYQTAWGQAFGFDFPAWSASLNVQVPIGNRSASAQLSQTRTLETRLATQLTKSEQAVIVEVRNVVQVIATQRKSLDAAQLTTALFQEQLDAQTARYEAGFSSDFELLRYQRDVVDAQVKELRAAVDLQLGTLALQKATDTLLDAYGAASGTTARPLP